MAIWIAPLCQLYRYRFLHIQIIPFKEQEDQAFSLSSEKLRPAWLVFDKTP
jgi:hypothetical protein